VNGATAAGHEHHEADRRRLTAALVIVLATAVVELGGSIVTGSLALLADVGHVLADVVALVLALVGVWFAGRPHTLQWTFGFHRVEVLAAALNGLTLLAISALITVEAVMRLRHPSEVEAVGLIVVAFAGLVANAVVARMLGHSHSMNMRAARLHVLSDLGGSAVAVTAGVVIALTGSSRVDPLLSLAIVALIVVAALRLLRDAVTVLLDRVPRGLDLAEVERALRELPGVLAVHDMHCWMITTDFIAFAAHLQVAPGHDPQQTIEAASTLLAERYAIAHTTLQPEVTPVYQPVELRD
jgi:cobalt-zinc-cadmium efflux system protein